MGTQDNSELFDERIRAVRAKAGRARLLADGDLDATVLDAIERNQGASPVKVLREVCMTLDIGTGVLAVASEEDLAGIIGAWGRVQALSGGSDE